VVRSRCSTFTLLGRPSLSALAIRIWSRSTCAFAFGHGIVCQVLQRVVEEAPAELSAVICVSSLIWFPNYLTILDQFEVGAFSCRMIDTRI